MSVALPGELRDRLAEAFAFSLNASLPVLDLSAVAASQTASAELPGSRPAAACYLISPHRRSIRAT
ncbi:hypothetical protein [Amycolatopsis nivea]|uniref:hypothetical protein n=1 Tax=Amycolatopsis nivea TaxID=1644109 RepID=UPI00106FE8F2|nr:hypothetical protein [Amycolatopsis nivea]